MRDKAASRPCCRFKADEDQKKVRDSESRAPKITQRSRKWGRIMCTTALLFSPECSSPSFSYSTPHTPYLISHPPLLSNISRFRLRLLYVLLQASESFSAPLVEGTETLLTEQS
ncbi:uncharacterized [Tachysurus ichikawai]